MSAHSPQPGQHKCLSDGEFRAAKTQFAPDADPTVVISVCTQACVCILLYILSAPVMRVRQDVQMALVTMYIQHVFTNVHWVKPQAHCLNRRQGVCTAAHEGGREEGAQKTTYATKETR